MSRVKRLIWSPYIGIVNGSCRIESYVDRSNFLRESSRYAVLFTYERDDYNSWAWGLQNCGYATDPNYARSLIRIIEELNLNEQDSAANPWFHPIRAGE